MKTLTLDKIRPRNPTRTKRVEQFYARQLRRLAEHVGALIAGFPPGDIQVLPTLEQMLRSYAQSLTPWAERTAARMIEDVNHADIESWRRAGKELSLGIRKEIESAPTGETFRRLMREQVELIQSIPIEAAQRVHKLTIEGLENSVRAKEIAQEIMRSGEVARSRAMLIARTETARTAANLTQARAQHVGSDGYIWRTSKDGDVRPSHKEMAGKFVKWSDPPTLDNLTGHAGCLPNCRCWAEVIIPE